jgi:arylsulfatase A-like enzyme
VPPRPPHIVLVTLDQWRYDAAGFAGYPISAHLRTPHLDRLARRGVVFDAAYTSTPVCVPARASLVSGRLGYEYGWRPAPEWIGPDRPTIPRLLGAAGYRTVACGKMHFQPLRQSHGFHEMVLCEHGGPEYYRRDDYHPWLEAKGYDDPFELWQFPPNYHLASAAFKANLQALPSPLPERVYSTTWIADRAVDLIDRHDPRQPLFMWLSFLKPHHPFDPPRPWDTFYDPAALPLPDRSPGALERLPAPAREALQSRTASRVFDLSVIDGDGGEALLRRLRAYYFAAVSHVDHQLGRVLAALERRGMAADTAYLATSDHGDYLGNRGQVFKDHRGTLLYEDLVRVPLFVTPPSGAGAAGVPRPTRGEHWSHPVQHVDLLPTVAALAGVPAPDDLPGRDLLSHLHGEAPPGGPDGVAQRWALSEAAGGRSAAFRRGRFKYILDPRDPLQQLFDLEADPGERYNLGGEPAYRHTEEALRRALDEHRRPVERDG